MSHAVSPPERREPEPELREIVARVQESVDCVDFSAEISRFDLGTHLSAILRSRVPYKYRAALVKVLGAKTVLEVGTKTGCGALAMAKYADWVLSCDITLERILDRRIFGDRIEGRQLAGPEDCLDLDYPRFDFVFIDIDHQGTMERRIHQVLRSCYQGIVLYDDIDFNDGMRQFWKGVENEKATTAWHPPYGAGLVRY
jgi:predicted O-methyltransferase YrrM